MPGRMRALRLAPPQTFALLRRSASGVPYPATQSSVSAEERSRLRAISCDRCSSRSQLQICRLKGGPMAEFIRVAEFEADQAALDALLAELNSTGGPPEDVPATRITVLANRSAGKVLIGTRFASE